MDNIVEPGGGWISGPMVYRKPEPDDEADVPFALVDAAYAALTAFGDNLDRRAAFRLFSMWKHRDALSASQRVALLKRFPSRGDR